MHVRQLFFAAVWLQISEIIIHSFIPAISNAPLQVL